MWGKNEAEAFNLIIPRTQTIQEVEFLTWAFRSFAKNRVHRTLDLGCGAGRIAVELASKGYSVTAIDKFPSMLAKARQNATVMGVRLDLLRTSLNDLKVSGHFDAAYSIQGPFSYVLTDDGLASSLTRVNAVLQPGGVLIIDVMNFASLYDRFKPVFRTTRKGKGWWVRRVVTNEIDGVNMLWHNNEENKMKLKGVTTLWHETHVFRMWTFPELKRHLLAAGFADIRLFGGLQARTKEATTKAPRLVTVAVRPV
ncbi:MAG TPA: class I SAM-dependent methyltransferase [Nitrososphaerales archaeon]|nr:class I SAM-dependent methyltransferase [Nitrososphaerales archaeon]